MEEGFEFVSNYSDLSTDRGFQFEFNCDRCGNGFRTGFKPSATGTISGALNAASSIFGGVFSNAADLGDRFHTAAWERAHDTAFKDAVAEIKQDFAQCPRCSAWVCRKTCWNNKRGLCKECAPDMGVEMSAAQSSRSVEEVWAHAKMSSEDKHLAEADWRETIAASCPKCGHSLETNAKFCPECGHNLQANAFCKECGAKLQPNARFCQQCGTKA